MNYQTLKAKTAIDSLSVKETFNLLEDLSKETKQLAQKYKISMVDAKQIMNDAIAAVIPW